MNLWRWVVGGLAVAFVLTACETETRADAKPAATKGRAAVSAPTTSRGSAGGTVIDHQQGTLEHLRSIPAAAIQRAKQTLQIAYGHTSHGSQLPSGMQPLDQFMGGTGLYTFNATGAGGALRFASGAGYDKNGGMVGDAGWAGSEGRLNFETETTKYLGSPTGDGRGSKQPEINVILWSFCGQMSGFDANKQVQWYLDGMGRLDAAYPGVTFVRMTGHLDGSGVNGRLNQNNELVRADCRAKGKWLFDFADLESYDPDGNEYLSRGGKDDCSYNGGNWATAWQNSHTEGKDWYRCGAAHSQPLNGNRKAYAAWALFAAVAEARG